MDLLALFGGHAVRVLLDPGEGGMEGLLTALASGSITALEGLQPREVTLLDGKEAAATADRLVGYACVHGHGVGGEPVDVEVHYGPAGDAAELLLRPAAEACAADPGDSRYRRLIEETSEGYWCIDIPSLTTIDANDAICRMLGVSRAGLIGRSPFEFVDAANRAVLEENTARIGTSNHRSFEVTLRTADGRPVPAHFNGTTVYDPAGRPQYAYAFVTDLTRIKEAQRALDESEARFRILFEDAAIGMAIATERGSLLETNPAFQRFLGYSAEELRGMVPEAIVHPDDLAKDAGLFEAVRSGRRTSYQVEKRYRRKDGGFVWGRLTLSVCPSGCDDNCADRTLVVVMVEDIDQRRRFEETLRAHRNRLDEAQRVASIGSWEWDLVTDRMWWSDELYAIFGYSPGWLEPGFDLVLQHTHPDDRQDLLEAERAARERIGRTTQSEFRIRRGDGSVRWIYAYARTDGDKTGRPTRLVGTAQDITARRQMETERDRLAAVLEATPDLVATTDVDGRCRYLNRGGRRLLGLGDRDALGALIEVLYADSADRQLLEEGLAVAARDGVWRGEGTLCHRDGGEVPVSQVVVAHYDPVGRPESFSVVARDISERKALENGLRAACERAEDAARAKSQFLANMSHEIRTPMSSIIGMADLLAETDLTEEQRRYVETFRNAGDGLMQTLNDVLDLSKVEAGQLALEEQPFDLGALLRAQVDLFGVQARDKGLELSLDLGPEVPSTVVGDEHRLRQILGNLLGNAIKFTDRGRVRLEVMRNPDLRGPGALLFRVSDTGAGIPEEKLAAVFEPFQQGDGGIDRRYGGTGLGLTIVQRLVELMEGTLSVESRPGEGTTIAIALELPVAEAAAAPSGHEADRPTTAAATEPMRLLIADDSPDIVLLLKAYLKGQPVEVETVEDGEAAVAAVRNGRYDLALMDIQMPGMDGLTATRRIREWEQAAGRHHLPIVALTAHAMEEHRNRARDAGCDGYLTKPVKKDRLLAALQTYTAGG